MMKKYLLIGLICLGFWQCDDKQDINNQGLVQGYKPIYASSVEMSNIGYEAPRKLIKPVKIYVKGNYLYINEYNEGVHVYNNIDPEKPVAVGFIKIPGNQDIEIKDDVLYADNGLDLIAIDISNQESAKLIKRIEKVFPISSYPPAQNVKFECVDESKGVVLGWKLTEIENPKCYR